ncbi:hypothetical protein J3F83DRAFT_739619 [Trichoderma novae-zelandiae]
MNGCKMFFFCCLIPVSLSSDVIPLVPTACRACDNAGCRAALTGPDTVDPLICRAGPRFVVVQGVQIRWGNVPSFGSWEKGNGRRREDVIWGGRGGGVCV